MTGWLIRRLARGSVGGVWDDGYVYVVRCDGAAFVPGTWSSTKDPAKATVFDTEDEARSALFGRWWVGVSVVAAADAELLPVVPGAPVAT